MKVGVLCFLLAALSVDAAEVTRAGRWELHSSFWMNLHQTLMHDASARRPRDMQELSDAERSVWSASIAAYREAAPHGSITFAEPMRMLQDELTQVADDAPAPLIRHPLGEAMLRAAPVYRTHWWPRDDAGNRFLLGYTAAMLRDAGEELVAAHEKVYGTKFPDSIRVDVAAYAGTFGAYSHPLDHGFVVTMSSREYGNHGLTALEIVLHESSHSVIYPDRGPVAGAIAAAVKARETTTPPDLWHAILFSTTSELTRRALAERGADGYIPMSKDLLTRAWPQYREAIEANWIPYLSGRGSLSQAVENIVAALKAPVAR